MGHFVHYMSIRTTTQSYGRHSRTSDEQLLIATLNASVLGSLGIDQEAKAIYCLVSNVYARIDEQTRWSRILRNGGGGTQLFQVQHTLADIKGRVLVRKY